MPKRKIDWVSDRRMHWVYAAILSALTVGAGIWL